MRNLPLLLFLEVFVLISLHSCLAVPTKLPSSTDFEPLSSDDGKSSTPSRSIQQKARRTQGTPDKKRSQAFLQAVKESGVEKTMSATEIVRRTRHIFAKSKNDDGRLTTLLLNHLRSQGTKESTLDNLTELRVLDVRKDYYRRLQDRYREESGGGGGGEGGDGSSITSRLRRYNEQRQQKYEEFLQQHFLRGKTLDFDSITPQEFDHRYYQVQIKQHYTPLEFARRLRTFLKKANVSSDWQAHYNFIHARSMAALSRRKQIKRREKAVGSSQSSEGGQTSGEERDEKEKSPSGQRNRQDQSGEIVEIQSDSSTRRKERKRKGKAPLEEDTARSSPVQTRHDKDVQVVHDISSEGHHPSSPSSSSQSIGSLPHPTGKRPTTGMLAPKNYIVRPNTFFKTL